VHGASRFRAWSATTCLDVEGAALGLAAHFYEDPLGTCHLSDPLSAESGTGARRDSVVLECFEAGTGTAMTVLMLVEMLVSSSSHSPSIASSRQGMAKNRLDGSANMSSTGVGVSLDRLSKEFRGEARSQCSEPRRRTGFLLVLLGPSDRARPRCCAAGGHRATQQRFDQDRWRLVVGGKTFVAPDKRISPWSFRTTHCGRT